MPQWTLDAMRRRLIRYADLQPCDTGFGNRSAPGCAVSESFTIITPGMASDANQYVHLREQHGFSVLGARQAFGCVTPQSTRETAEVLVAHSGHWRLHFGPNGEDGSVDLAPGDVVSVRTGIFRGFSKLDEGKGFLWILLGQTNEPIFSSWMAKGDCRIDTANGEYQLQNVVLEQHAEDPTHGEGSTHATEDFRRYLMLAQDIIPNPSSPLAAEGVEEAGVLVPRATSDRFPAGRFAGCWPHGFNLRWLTLETGAYIPLHARARKSALSDGTYRVSEAKVAARRRYRIAAAF